MLAVYGEYVTDVERVGQEANPTEREVAHEAHTFAVSGGGSYGGDGVGIGCSGFCCSPN
jgi:hypothetical protein